jgi:UDP-N-acetylmuramoyl-tripeptide--D-alanyl-D-alanine ligase
MRVALDSFTALKAEQKAVILGDMLELGEKSEEEHLKILKMLQSDFAGQVFLVGKVFQKISLKSGFKTFLTVDKLIEFIKDEPIKGNTILIKGSRGIKLERIYDLL